MSQSRTWSRSLPAGANYHLWVSMRARRDNDEPTLDRARTEAPT